MGDYGKKPARPQAYQERVDRVRKAIGDLLEKHGLEQPYCGFYVGEGWIPLLDETLMKLFAAGMRSDQIAQVKSKFCELRFYLDHDAGDLQKRNLLESIIKEAEAKSTKLCEDCGKPHGLSTPRSGIALCLECEKEDRR